MANPIFQGLNKYVDEQRPKLISKLGLDAVSAKEFEVLTGVKYQTAINLLDADATFQDGTACGWNAAGSDTFSQRILKVGSIKVEDAICQNAMQEYWMNYQVQVGAGRKNLPFEEEIAQKYVDSVNKKLEKAIWQGTIATDKFDGLATILTTGSGVNEVNATGNGAYADVLAVYNAIPDEALDKAVIYVNYAEFRALAAELVAKNLYHYTPEVNASMELILPGTSTRVKGVPGLSGLDSIFALVPEHTFYGCDLVSDKDDFKIWYSQDEDEFRVRIAFTAGVQVAFPDETVRLDY